MGAVQTNHGFGPDARIGASRISWRFTVGLGARGIHEESPGMRRETAIRGARLMAAGDVSGALDTWGPRVRRWLDQRPHPERAALLRAAAEMGRALA